MTIICSSLSLLTCGSRSLPWRVSLIASRKNWAPSSSAIPRVFLITVPHRWSQTALHRNTFTHEFCTQRRFYTETLLHTEPLTRHTNAFAHRRFYTQTLLHGDPFTHRSLYTQTLLHTKLLTEKHFYTQTLLHTNIFTQRRCTHRPFEPCHGFVRLQCHIVEAKQLYTETLLRTKPAHRDAFTPKHFYTQTLYTTHKRFCTQTLYTQTLLHRDPFTHRSFYTQTLLHTNLSRRETFYTQTLLHTNVFTQRRLGIFLHSFVKQKKGPWVFWRTLAKQLCTETILHEFCTQRRFYTETLLHTEPLTLHTNAFTHRRFYTQTLLHGDPFTHRSLYTQTLLHTNLLTEKHFYTQTLLHTNIFTQRRCTHRPFEPCHGSVRLQCHIVEAKQLYTETLSRTKPAHRDAFTPKRFYTQTLLHDTQTLLHTDAFTHRRFYTETFYTQKLFHTDPFTHKYIYRETLLHTDAFTYKHLHTETCRHFFSHSFVKPKNCQIGGVSVFFEESRSKKHRKHRVFWRLANPKPRYLRCVLLLVPKTTVITVFCGQHLST